MGTITELESDDQKNNRKILEGIIKERPDEFFIVYFKGDDYQVVTSGLTGVTKKIGILERIKHDILSET